MTEKERKGLKLEIYYHGKRCIKCGSDVRLTSTKECVHCKTERDKIRQHKPENIIFKKEQDLYLKYDIDFERYNWIKEFERQYNLQPDVILCPFCMQPLDFTITYQTKFRVSIDHDHVTGLIRGAIHDLCNRTIGQLEWMNPDHPALKQYMEFVREFQFAYYEKFPDPCQKPIKQKPDKTVQLTEIELPLWNIDAWYSENDAASSGQTS